MGPKGDGGAEDGFEDYAPGTLIWIRSDEEVWQAAEVMSSGKEELVVKVEQTNEQSIVNPAKDPIYLRGADLYTAEGRIFRDRDLLRDVPRRFSSRGICVLR